MKKNYFGGAVAAMCAVVSIFCVVFFGLLWLMPVEGSNADVWGVRWLMFCSIIAAGFYGYQGKKLYGRLQEPW